jgi:hypothetical protein
MAADQHGERLRVTVEVRAQEVGVTEPLGHASNLT